jgi:enoyl-[acyl-carrier protein] reductase II
MSRPSLARILGIDHPILQGGMTWVGRHALAAAVSEAGALGVIGSGGMESEELREEIRALRALTVRSFAVNVPLVDVRPCGDEGVVERMIDVVLDERVPIVVTSAGSPSRFTARLKAAGATVLHVVPSVPLARKAADAGVDAIVAESSESGGHVRSDGLATFSLVPQVVDAVRLPVVAAGGICDARGVAAALALGAEGVQLGTLFVATTECNAHPIFKAALLAAESEGTAVYCRHHHASRALATPAVERLVEMESAGASPAELAAFRGRGRAREGCLLGDVERGILPAGAAVGLVREIRPAGEVVRELVRGFSDVLASMRAAFGAADSASLAVPRTGRTAFPGDRPEAA